MSVLFPIRLDGTRFFVNPTKLDVQKRSQISEVRTMGGTTFQIWPNLPEEIKFFGMAFGLRSIRELRSLDSSIMKRPSEKEVVLKYKFNAYSGYVRDVSVKVDAEKPRQFEYSFSFVSKDRFLLETMTLGQLTGLKVETDFIEGQLRGAVNVVGNIPSRTFANLSNAGRSVGRIGLNIGRPRLPIRSAFR